MLKFWLKWLGATATIAVIVYYVLLLNLPKIIMNLAHKRGVDAVGVNQMMYAPKSDESVRFVLFPSPDLQYSMCSYDLSDGPITIEAVVPPTYWSMAFFQENTNNFKVYSSDELVPEEKIGVVLGLKMPENLPDGFDYLESPTPKGIVLLRMAGFEITSPEKRERWQRLANCRPYNKQSS